MTGRGKFGQSLSVRAQTQTLDTPSGGQSFFLLYARRTQAGRSDVRYGLSFAYPTSATNYSLRAEVYLGTGESSFPVLLERKEELEAECDYPLVWEELENARSSRIAIYLDPADPAVREEWPNYRDWGIAALGELRRVFAEAIGELPYAP